MGRGPWGHWKESREVGGQVACLPPQPSLTRPGCARRRDLDSLSGKGRGTGTSVALPIAGMILSLQDLITYFQHPEEQLQHEEKQSKLRSLRSRQNLFQEEVGAGRAWGGVSSCHVPPQS